MTKAWKPLSEKRGFNRLAKELKRERKNAQPAKPAPKKEEKKLNEQIKKLAEQANAQYCDLDDASCFKRLGLVEAVVFKPEDLKKFVELIVRECIAQAVTEEERYDSLDERDCDYCSMAMANFQGVLAKHFGVEE